MRKHNSTTGSCDQSNLEALLQSFQKVLDVSHMLIYSENQLLKNLSYFISNMNQFYDQYLAQLLSEISLYHACTKYLFLHLRSFILGLDSEEMNCEGEVKKVFKSKLNYGFKNYPFLKHIDFDGLLEKFLNQSFRDNEQYHNYLIQFSLLILQIIGHQLGSNFLSEEKLLDVASTMMVLSGSVTIPSGGLEMNQVLENYFESQSICYQEELRAYLFPVLSMIRKNMMALFFMICLVFLYVAPSEAYWILIFFRIWPTVTMIMDGLLDRYVSKWPDVNQKSFNPHQTEVGRHQTEVDPLPLGVEGKIEESHEDGRRHGRSPKKLIFDEKQYPSSLVSSSVPEVPTAQAHPDPQELNTQPNEDCFLFRLLKMFVDWMVDICGCSASGDVQEQEPDQMPYINPRLIM